MTDREKLEALQLSEKDLLKMAAKGKRARVARKPPRRLRRSRQEETQEVKESEVAGVIAIRPAPDLVIEDVKLNPGVAARR